MRNRWEGPTPEDIDASPQLVEEKLEALRPGSSPGPDAIHPRVLRDSSHALRTPLSTIFRKSLDAGELPPDWKSGEVVPIFQKGDRHKPENYRPVSLTAIPVKILEPIIRDSLLQHFCGNGITHSSQHGFLPRRSCTTQLMEVMEHLSACMEDCMEDGDPVDVAYLDFAKAFDSMPTH